MAGPARLLCGAAPPIVSRSTPYPMHCVHCGAILPPEATRCPACDRPLADDSPRAPLPVSPAGPREPPGEPVASLSQRLQAALGSEYAVERQVGQGGFAMVFLVRDRTLKRALAVKVLSPDLVLSKSLIERFRREAETIAQLSHAHIVPVHFVGQREDLFYLAMAFVEGETLADRLERQGALPVEEAARIFREIASALELAHRRGVIHRDIKPQNVLLERDSGRALLTDFGIARTAEASALTASGMVVGTPAYMSPEQVTGDTVDHRTDLYALGTVAYQMLAGKPPFTGTTPEAVLFRRVAEAPEPIERVRPHVPASLAELVNRCLAPDPAKRPASAAEIVQGLGGATPPSGTGSLPRPLARRRRRVWVGGALAGLGVVAVTGTLLLVIRRQAIPALPALAVPDGMVLIPGGSYTIGANEGHSWSRPAHTVPLDTFAIDRTEVTVEAYARFMATSGAPAPWSRMPDPAMPVTGVTWAEAQAYCRARTPGGRLPTEAEWEAAARGPEGRKYPWGTAWEPSAAVVGLAAEASPEPVASRPGGATPTGIYDLVGNAWEWTASPMEPYVGGEPAPRSQGTYVIRGAGFNTPRSLADATYRGYMTPAASRQDLRATGFRCALTLSRAAHDLLGRRRVRVEHVEGHLPVAVRLFPPDRGILTAVGDSLARRIVPAQLVGPDRIGQVPAPGGHHRGRLPPAGEPGEGKETPHQPTVAGRAARDDRGVGWQDHAGGFHERRPGGEILVHERLGPREVRRTHHLGGRGALVGGGLARGEGSDQTNGEQAAWVHAHGASIVVVAIVVVAMLPRLQAPAAFYVGQICQASFVLRIPARPERAPRWSRASATPSPLVRPRAQGFAEVRQHPAPTAAIAGAETSSAGCAGTSRSRGSE